MGSYASEAGKRIKQRDARIAALEAALREIASIADEIAIGSGDARRLIVEICQRRLA